MDGLKLDSPILKILLSQMRQVHLITKANRKVPPSDTSYEVSARNGDNILSADRGIPYYDNNYETNVSVKVPEPSHI